MGASLLSYGSSIVKQFIISFEMLMNNLYERASQKIEIHKLLKTIVSKVQFM
jgi:hypothetical protein